MAAVKLQYDHVDGTSYSRHVPEGYTRSVNLKMLLDYHRAGRYSLVKDWRGDTIVHIWLPQGAFPRILDVHIPSDVYLDKTEMIADLLENS